MYPNGMKNGTGEGALNMKIGTNTNEPDNLNPITGHIWGPVFTVLDETQSISTWLRYGAASSSDINKQHLSGGGAGIALWDVEAGGFIEGTFRNGSPTAGTYSIPLTGLEGKEVMLVAIDRNKTTCVWADDITAPIGSVMLNDADKMHTVKWEFNFDEPGNFQGWTGDTDKFSVGYKIADNMFGFITPDLRTNADAMSGLNSFASGENQKDYDSWTGSMTSPKFEIDGDVIEFMIGGGESASLSFDLMVDLLGDGNYVSAEQSRSVGQDGQFYYDYWDVMDYKGLSAYLQLSDLALSNWAWIGVDNIRMLEFGTPTGGGDSGSVPEPATWLLLLLGMAGLVWSRRRGFQ